MSASLKHILDRVLSLTQGHAITNKDAEARPQLVPEVTGQDYTQGSVSGTPEITVEPSRDVLR